MKNAKTMFEELGYKQEISKQFIKYYNEKEDIYVWFDKICKDLEVTDYFDIKMLQAINKQIEELGWNND